LPVRTLTAPTLSRDLGGVDAVEIDQFLEVGRRMEGRSPLAVLRVA